MFCSQLGQIWVTIETSDLKAVASLPNQIRIFSAQYTLRLNYNFLLVENGHMT